MSNTITQKLWVKFNELDVECFCYCNRKECPPESKPKCKEYIVKFIEIERKPLINESNTVMDEIGKIERKINQQKKKYETELRKSLRELKKFKI